MKLVARIVASLALLTVATLAVRTRHRTGPCLEISPSEIRFSESGTGAAPSESDVAVFHVANVGTEPLVARVRTSCSCLLLSGTELKLEPGQRDMLRFRVTRPTIGLREASIVLTTNDAKARERRLKIVIPGLNKVPFVVQAGLEKVSFLNVTRNGHVKTVAIRTVEASNTDPWIASWMSSAGYVSANLIDISNSPIEEDARLLNRTYTFDLVLEGLPPRGTHLSTIALMDRTRTNQVANIAVLVNRVAPCYAVPSALFLEAGRSVRI